MSAPIDLCSSDEDTRAPPPPPAPKPPRLPAAKRTPTPAAAVVTITVQDDDDDDDDEVQVLPTPPRASLPSSPPAAPPRPPPVCGTCGKQSFDDGSPQPVGGRTLSASTVFSLDCGALACGGCVASRVQKAVKAGGAGAGAGGAGSNPALLVDGCWQVACPCGSPSPHPLSDSEIAGAGGKYWAARVDEIRTAVACASLDMVTCPCCSTLMERLPPPPPQDPAVVAAAAACAASSKIPPMVHKDDDGKPMSDAAVAHRDTHRMRCPQCLSSWCTNCASTPYHTGLTCTEEATRRLTAECRFCDARVAESGGVPVVDPLGPLPPVGDVCASEECRTRARSVCVSRLPCGHRCNGMAGETTCPPCLLPSCAASGAQSGSDFCNICFVEGLSSAPCIELGCSHVFHAACVKQRLASKWPGARINFGFANCALCSSPLTAHPSLPELDPLLALRKEVEQLAGERLKAAKMENDKEVQLGGRHEGKPLDYALDRFSYYPCSKCSRPYFGGLRACGEGMADAAGGGGAGGGLADLICPRCQPMPPGQTVCKLHGNAELQFKCKFCCERLALWCECGGEAGRPPRAHGPGTHPFPPPHPSLLRHHALLRALPPHGGVRQGAPVPGAQALRVSGAPPQRHGGRVGGGVRAVRRQPGVRERQEQHVQTRTN